MFMQIRARVSQGFIIAASVGLLGNTAFYFAGLQTAKGAVMNTLILLVCLACVFSLFHAAFLKIESGIAYAEALAVGETDAPDKTISSDNELERLFYAMNRTGERLREALEAAKKQEERATQAGDELFIQTTQLEMIVQERTQELDAAQEHTQLILDSIAEGIIELDMDNLITFVNSTALQILGYDLDSLLGLDFFVGIPHFHTESELCANPDCALHQAIKADTPQFIAKLWLLSERGHAIPVSFAVSPILKHDVKVGAVIAFTDLTETLEANRMIDAIYEYSSEGYVLFSDQFEPLDCNPAMTRLLKIGDKAEFLENYFDFCPLYQPCGETSESFFKQKEGEVRDRSHVLFEWTHLDSLGKSISCVVTLTRIGVDQHRTYIAGVYDMSDQKKAELALTEQREQLQEILDSSPTAMAIVCDGVVHKVNDNCEDLLGLTVGDESQKIYADMDDFKSALKEISAGDEIKNRAFRLRNARDEILDTLLSFHPFIYEGKASILTWITDVTELMHAKILAEEASRVKSDFLASMSHEIRTPMNAILGMTYLCLQTGLTDKQHGYVEKIQGAANTLLSLINDILDFSKIESGKFILEKAPFRLSDTLRSLWDLVAFRAEERGIVFRMDVDPGVPSAFVGDSLRLNQILLNLCNNAIKFTEKGHITLTIKPEGLQPINGSPDAPAAAKLLFTVEDSGIGMTKEQIGKLFNPFVQADGSITRKYGGSGLGLSISKYLVESMGGEIWVESRFRVGSAFRFTVILEVVDDSAENSLLRTQPADESAHEEDWRVSPIMASILLVEDNEINQEIAIELLTQAGAEVNVARNGVEAIAMVGAARYDLVLMDVQMPIMDGLEATRQIRKMIGFPARELPIIAMTAHAMKGDYEKSISAGMNDHITKPIDPKELYNTLRKWLAPKTKEHNGGNEKMAGETQGGLRDQPGISIAQGLKYINGNEKLFVMLLKKFPAQFQNAAAEITSFLAEGKIEDASRIAHSVKGSGSTLGMAELASAAAALEQSIKNSSGEYDALHTDFASKLDTVMSSIKLITGE